RVRRDDAAGATRAIPKRGRDDEGALAADLHGGDALVPALDDLPRANAKLKRLTAINRTIEFLALRTVVVEPAGVMHHGGLARGRRASADDSVGVLQAGGCGHFLSLLGECGRGESEDERSKGNKSGTVHRYFSCNLTLMIAARD